jgi:hypothetical protein
MIVVKSIRVNFDKLLATTAKAYLIKINGSEHWIPISTVRNMSTKNNLSGKAEIATFIYEKIFDCNVSEMTDEEKRSIGSWIVEKHTPRKIDFNPNNLPDASLTK